MRWRYLKLDLPYLLGELVIVVVGVVIALMANGAYEDWKEDRIESDYLLRIGADLEIGAAQLSNRERRNSLSLAAGKRLIDLLEQESPDENDVLANFPYVAQTGGTAADSSHDTTFRELVSTGNLNIIRDPELRVEIANYYRQLDNYIRIDDRLPIDLPLLFRSLTGSVPERYTRNIDGTRREFSDDEKHRILTELLGDRDHYLKLVRTQTALQDLIEFNLQRLINSNALLAARLLPEG